MPGRGRDAQSSGFALRGRTLFLGVLALITALLFLVYGWSLRAPFLFDDVLSLVGNGSIRQLWPLWSPSPGETPLHPPVNNPTAGRPLVNVSFALNRHFGGDDPAGYRAFNLLAHALAATLLWSIVRRTLRLDFFGDRFDRAADVLALLVALVWALHPLQTETLEYVTQRTELLMGLCFLATLSASLSYFQATTPADRRFWLTLAGLACVAGVACKEVMVTAPVMVLLYERTFLTGSLRAAMRRSAPLYGVLFSSWLVLFALNYGNPRFDSAGFHFSVPAYVWWCTQAKVLLMYLKLAIWPWPLAIHYGTPYLDTFSAAWPWVAAAGVLVLGALVLYWRGTAAGYIGAWVLTILSPTLVVPIVTEVVAERRMYLPLAGIVALAVAGGYALCAALKQREGRTAAPEQTETAPRPKNPGRGKSQTAARRPAERDGPLWIVAGCSLAVAVAFGCVSALRLTAYRDSLTLWAATVASQPESSFAQSNFGNELLNHGHPKEAVEHLERAMALPHFNEANVEYALGTALALSGRPAEGVEHLEASLKINPDSAHAHGNLAQTLLLLGKREQALEHFAAVMRLDAHSPMGLLDYGSTLIALGRAGEAIPALARLAQLQPDNVDAHRNLGIAYGSVQQLGEAIAEFKIALKLAGPSGPVPAELHRLLGVALMNGGDLPQAIAEFEQAVRLHPNNPALEAALRDARDRQRQGGKK